MTWLSDRVLAWYDSHGRTSLPWRQDRTPYRVWVSEIMLQQTQVSTVAPYFERFIQRFPDVGTLAAAKQDEVLSHWAGLGYYARARNLHRAARQVHKKLPDSFDGWLSLPGIGRSTAGAIWSIGYGHRATILDSNVKRIVSRFHAVEGYPGKQDTERSLWTHAKKHTPFYRPGDYSQGIMDFGAKLCKRSKPACTDCPLSSRCLALARGMQHSLPQSRPTKAPPVHVVRAFLMIDPEGACLLEHRPDHGIWGGLWSPPEREIETDPKNFSREWNVEVIRSVLEPMHRHSFSHFHLDVSPQYLWVRRRPNVRLDENRFLWYHRDQNRELGLSALAAKLLDHLSNKFDQG